ncbi:hypothetical protein ACFQ2C_11625 [Sphingobacterium daejeonense]|uniref:DUF2892 domain-containing protein n=1 Tax=Sphingobacterium daejeonense TaxID=371142 RepID=A0ABW3RNJ5_9SPHI
MIKHYLAQWNIMRVLGLIMGVVIIVQGVKAEMWLIVALGILFSIRPLFNMGCSADGSCQVQPKSRKD